MAAPLFGAQSLDERTAVRQFVQTEHRVDEGLLLLSAYGSFGQLAELRRDVVRAGERLLTATRRLARLALNRSIAEMHHDPHLMSCAGAKRGNRRVVHHLYLAREIDAPRIFNAFGRELVDKCIAFD